MAFDPAGHVEMIDIEMHAALGSFGCEPLPGSAAEEEETGEAAEFALDDEALSEASLNTLTEAEADAQARREGLCLVRNPQVESGFTGVRTCVDGAGQKVYQATRRCLDARSSKTRRHDGDYFTYPAQAALQYARWVGPQGWVGPAQVVSTPLPDAVVKHVGAALAIAKAANEGLTLELAPGTSTGYRGVKPLTVKNRHARNQFQARVKVGPRCQDYKYLGSFVTPEEAALHIARFRANDALMAEGAQERKRARLSAAETPPKPPARSASSSADSVGPYSASLAVRSGHVKLVLSVNGAKRTPRRNKRLAEYELASCDDLEEGGWEEKRQQKRQQKELARQQKETDRRQKAVAMQQKQEQKNLKKQVREAERRQKAAEKQQKQEQRAELARQKKDAEAQKPMATAMAIPIPSLMLNVPLAAASPCRVSEPQRSNLMGM